MNDGACEVVVGGDEAGEATALSVRISMDLRAARELGGPPQHVCVSKHGAGRLRGAQGSPL